MENKPCCPDKMEVKALMFYYRGKYFSGLVCTEHNALFDNPKDSFLDFVAQNENKKDNHN